MKASQLKIFDYNQPVPQFPNSRCFTVDLEKHRFKSLLVFSNFEDDLENLWNFMNLYDDYVKSLGKQPIKGGGMNELLSLKKLTSSADYSLEKIEPDFNDQKEEVKFEENQFVNKELDSTYSGKLRNGLPHGQGTEFFNKEGISYIGDFVNGKKHGQGYIVNSNLDTFYCEFINNELVGL